MDYQKDVNEMKKLLKILQKIQVVKGLAYKAFNGYGNFTYIDITLREVQLTKQLFVLNMQ